MGIKYTDALLQHMIKLQMKLDFPMPDDMYLPLGVKPIIHQSELRTYTKVVPFKENSSFCFVVL